MLRSLDPTRISPRTTLLAVLAAILGVMALLARVGSDAGWLAALGHVIAHTRQVPAGVPFASSSTVHWPNALVLAELLFAGLQATLGARGLMLAQLAAAAAGMVILARDARRGGAEPVGIAGAIGLVAIGAPAALAIARVQLFSLVLFPLLVALLRAEDRQPSRRIWLAVPLLALWANLHGAVLLGLGILIGYLVLARGRHRAAEALAVSAASTVALWLTPALGRTGDYYLGLLTNAAAQRGAGMWGPLSLANPLDVLLVLAAVVLGFKLVRSRPPLWEAAVALALVVLTVRAERNGVWLLFFLAPPAARQLAPMRSLRTLAAPIGVAGVLLVLVAIARGPAPVGGAALVSPAIALAHGTPVLADSSLDEAVAVAGGRIWAGNPIDAFSRRVQNAYLSWLAGDIAAGAVPRAVDIVLVTKGTPEERLMASLPGFVVVRGSSAAILFQRRSEAPQ